MPIKVYHPDHGFVLTNDKAEIDILVAKGGKIVTKNREVLNETEKTQETPKAEVLAPTFTRQPHHNKRK